MLLLSFFRQFTTHIAYRIPYGEPANKDNSKEDSNDVFGVNANRIGIDNEISCLITKLYKTVCLL